MHEEIYKGVYQVKIPLKGNPLKELNSYLIKSNGECMLIDTGFNSEDCLNLLMEALEELEVNLNELKLVVTHLHSDHSGLASVLEKKGAKVYASKVDGEFINQMTGEAYWDAFKNYGVNFDLIRDDITFKDHPGYKYCPKEKCDFVYLKEGDVLSVGEYKLEVLETPGHTPGQIGLYEKTHKLYFGGDHILGKITPNIAYWGEGRNDLAVYFKSLEKIKKYDIDIVFAAHRGLVHDCKARIDELRSHHDERLQEVLDIVDSRMTVRDVAARMKWSLRCNDWNEFPDPQKWFASSEAMSHLEYLYYEGKLKKETVEEVFYYSK